MRIVTQGSAMLSTMLRPAGKHRAFSTSHNILHATAAQPRLNDVSIGITPIESSPTTDPNGSKYFSVPNYHSMRSAVAPGILHFGVGGFFRSHLAAYTDQALESDFAAAKSFGIQGVETLSPSNAGAHDTAKTLTRNLKEQDYLYTLLSLGPSSKPQSRIIGSMIGIENSPAGIINKMLNPDLKIVSLTVTENGYYQDDNGDLDLNNEAIAQDVAMVRKGIFTPNTPLGYIVAGLQLRMKQKLSPLTVLSCDNLVGNGKVMKQSLHSFADAVEPSGDLLGYIESEISCPNSMVDRITPRPTPLICDMTRTLYEYEDLCAVGAEDFSAWMLEDEFVAGRPNWDCGDLPGTYGVMKFVTSAAPYERMKLRLLNGGHTAMSYVASLLAQEQVHEACIDPDIERYLKGYMSAVSYDIEEETLREAFFHPDQLLARFSNPNVADQVERLCGDGTSKFQIYVQPVFSELLKQPMALQRYVLMSLAAWIQYLDVTPVDRIQDPSCDIVKPAAQRLCWQTDATTFDQQAAIQAVRGLLSCPFGQNFASALPEESCIMLLNLIASIRTNGVRRTIQTL